MMQCQSLLLLLSALLIPTLVTSNDNNLRSAVTFSAEERDLLRESSPSSSFAPPSGSGTKRHLAEDCPTPETFFYHAVFEIEVARNPTKACTNDDIKAIADRIDHHFDEYTFYTSELGPVEVSRTAPSCQETSGRRLEEEGDDSQKQLAALSTIDNEATTTSDQHHRKLWSIGWRLLASGPCISCGRDNRDKRRRKLYTGTTPISIFVATDSYPGEMSISIKDKDAKEIYSHNSFSYAHATKRLPMYVQAGQTYTLRMTDAYGDGWCCGYGGGGITIHEGLLGDGPQFAKIDTVFGKMKEVQFTVPVDIVGRSASIGSSDKVDSFMQLASKVSDYESFYIQQEFHMKSDSCLYHTYPSVVVTLTPGDEANPVTC